MGKLTNFVTSFGYCIFLNSEWPSPTSIITSPHVHDDILFPFSAALALVFLTVVTCAHTFPTEISWVVWHWFLQQGCPKMREQKHNGRVLCVPFSSFWCCSSSGCIADGPRWKKPWFVIQWGHFQCCGIEFLSFLHWVYVSQKTCKANWVFHAVTAYLTPFKNDGWNPSLWADVVTFRQKYCAPVQTDTF